MSDKQTTTSPSERKPRQPRTSTSDPLYPASNTRGNRQPRSSASEIQRGPRNNGDRAAKPASSVKKVEPRPSKPPHLISMGHLSVKEIESLLRTAIVFKYLYKSETSRPNDIIASLQRRTVALLFSKRSTRTRVASESATALLGGHAMFLGKDDIQLGVNETPEDTAKVVGSMVDGIMARVGKHEEIEVGDSSIS